jgi:hypothetical protein
LYQAVFVTLDEGERPSKKTKKEKRENNSQKIKVKLKVHGNAEKQK